MDMLEEVNNNFKNNSIIFNHNLKCIEYTNCNITIDEVKLWMMTLKKKKESMSV